MKPLTKISLVIIAIVSIGCAGPQIQKTLDSWIGKPETALIQQWGVPHNQFVKDNLTVYEYRYCSGSYGSSHNVQNVTFHQMSTNCSRWTYFIKDGIVTNATYDPR